MTSHVPVFICFGKTGTGKSTFIKAMGGAVPSEELSNDGTSQTSQVTFYQVRLRDGPISLVDVPGYQDTREIDADESWLSTSKTFSDESHARKLLRAFNEQKISQLNGVLWFINENRASKDLRAQAQFINGLINAPETPKDHDNWDHVLVMMFGTALGTAGIKAAVEKVTGSNEVPERLQIISLGLRKELGDPGSCDILMTESRGPCIQLSRPSREAVMQRIRCQSPIQWMTYTQICEVCLQSGDPRAFYPCHSQVEVTHLAGFRWNDNLSEDQHSQEDVQKWKSRGKKAAVVLGNLCLISATGITAAITVMAPNPVTAVATAHLAHMAAAAAAVGGAGAALKKMKKGGSTETKSSNPGFCAYEGCVGLDKPGCINRCIKCKKGSDETDYESSGCGNRNHKLVTGV